jgi:sulfoxide reductase heme-binding subunit YedZ
VLSSLDLLPTKSREELDIMRNRTIIYMKIVVWIACLFPLIEMYWQMIHEQRSDYIRMLEDGTGDQAISLLILALAVTPLRRLVPRLSWVIRFRRLIGLFAFFYASLHMLVYLGLYAHFSPTALLSSINERKYTIAGILAWCLLVPLAITSTTWWISALGGKRWKTLHQLTYATVILAIVHFWWSMEHGSMKPLKYTIVLGVILSARLWVRRPVKASL